MTTSQIQYVLEANGYSLDEWTDLAKFPLIFLDQDANVLTDTKNVLVRFNSSNQILEVANGQNNFFAETGTIDMTKIHRITFNIISGFSQTSSLFIRNFKYKK